MIRQLQRPSILRKNERKGVNGLARGRSDHSANTTLVSTPTGSSATGTPPSDPAQGPAGPMDPAPAKSGPTDPAQSKLGSRVVNSLDLQVSPSAAKETSGHQRSDDAADALNSEQ